MESKCKKLNDMQIDKLRKIMNDSKRYLEKRDLERLELSIIQNFPEVSFDEGTEDTGYGTGT